MRPHTLPWWCLFAFGCTRAEPAGLAVAEADPSPIVATEATKCAEPAAPTVAPPVIAAPTTTPQSAPPPVEPAPSVDAPPLAAAEDPDAVALSPRDPGAIAIVERRPIGGDTLVLFRHDVVRTRSIDDPDVCEIVAARPFCGPFGTALAPKCVHPSPSDLYCLGEETGAFAWELARIRPGTPRLVVARTRIVGPIDGVLEGAAPGLKVYDMDGDRRSEVQVKIGIPVPDWMIVANDQELEGDFEVGAIFDARDLHLQFAVVHRTQTAFGDVSGSSEDSTVSWVAKDLDGDRHADLTLREVSKTWSESPCDLECDEEVAGRPLVTRLEQVCPYDVAGDRWVCPAEQLGRRWLAMNDGVDVIHAAATAEPVAERAEVEPSPSAPDDATTAG
jgi:hypothetical protein